jgi:nucleoid DNA-binding protein
MTKKELAKAIADELNLPQETAKKAVQRVFDGIIHALVKEGRIELRDFGVFEVKRRKPRKARNPRSGESVEVPERVAVRFKPGKEMDEQVSQAMMAVGA